MSEDTAEAPPRKGKKGLIFGAAAAVALGAGGFFAVWSGLILGADPVEPEAHAEAPEPEEDPGIGQITDIAEVAFIAVEPLVVSLTGANASRHLRFRAQIEVAAQHRGDVEHLMPRVIDVMNGYLRAVEPASLSAPGALMQVRAQLLRRVGMVVGAGKIRDVLVMEFVLS